MAWIKTTLKKLTTNDGLCEVDDHVKVGDTYYYDNSSFTTMWWGHIENPTLVKPKVSVLVGATKTGGSGWMPWELFEEKK